MIIGLARTSTLEQIAGLEAQIRDLGAYGCERVFKEQVSSVAEREQLEAALGMLRTGDKLVATKLDRLARSVQTPWSDHREDQLSRCIIGDIGHGWDCG